MDRFGVTLYPSIAEDLPEHRRYRQAHIAINGRSLIELVRMAEEPWARAEYLERLPEFENPADDSAVRRQGGQLPHAAPAIPGLVEIDLDAGRPVVDDVGNARAVRVSQMDAAMVKLVVGIEPSCVS